MGLKAASRCEICSALGTKPKLLIPRSHGGSGNNKQNIIWLCVPCFQLARNIIFAERDNETESYRLQRRKYLSARIQFIHPALGEKYVERQNLNLALMDAVQMLSALTNKIDCPIRRAIRYLWLSDMLHTHKALEFSETDFVMFDDYLENL